MDNDQYGTDGSELMMKACLLRSKNEDGVRARGRRFVREHLYIINLDNASLDDSGFTADAEGE